MNKYMYVADVRTEITILGLVAIAIIILILVLTIIKKAKNK